MRIVPFGARQKLERPRAKGEVRDAVSEPGLILQARDGPVQPGWRESAVREREGHPGWHTCAFP